MAKHNNLANCSRTRKRHNKPTHSKPTLKYGGGRTLEWAKRNLVPKGLAKRLGWRKSSPSAQKEQSQQLHARYSNMEQSPIPTYDSEEEREEQARKQRAAPQHNTIPDTSTQKGINYKDELNPYAEIGNIGVAANTNMAHKTHPNTNIQYISPKASNPTELYTTAANIRKKKDAKTQSNAVLKQIKFPGPPPPPLPPKQIRPSSSSNHTYDVLPPREEEEIFERLPTMAQAAKRNSLKKSKSNVTAIWETATAAAKKSSSPKNRKSSLKIKPGTVGKIVANWGNK